MNAQDGDEDHRNRIGRLRVDNVHCVIDVEEDVVIVVNQLVRTQVLKSSIQWRDTEYIVGKRRRKGLYTTSNHLNDCFTENKGTGNQGGE